MRAMTPVKVESQYTRFGGGVDLMSPVLSIQPGMTLDAMNYEPGVFGGYSRIDGYERFDGRTSPSSATYHYAEVNITGTLAVGNTITGLTSGATGIVIVLGSADLAFTKVTGTFVKGESIQVAGVTVGSLLSVASPRGYRTGRDDAVALAAAADKYRADIGVVPGAGKILGVNMFNGVLYAFRNKADNSAAELYKSTTAGWVKVDLGEEIGFSNANASVGEGGVLTLGAVTATIKRVVVQTGTLASGTNTGRLIISGRAGGNFASGAATSTGGGTLTLSAAQTPIVLLPGGRFEFVNTNFSGSTDTYRMYGCDGVNRAFEFDGTVFTPITTGMTNDQPKFICAHKKKLFLAFKGSVQNSGDGNPYVWTVTLGASELAMGEEITGMLVQTGDTLAIFTRNSSWQLNGTTTNTFQLLPLAPEVGAIPYTAQNIAMAYTLDDRGIIQITRSQAYGNFEHSTVSRLVQPIIDAMRSKVIGSTTYKSRNQYRVYANDGTGVIMGVEGQKVIGITQFRYPVNPTCFCSGEDATGKDVIFFGADNGYVYQADRGSSFDGAVIESFIRLPFNNVKSPRYRKRYRKIVLEMSAVGYASIRFQPEFSYGDADVASHATQLVEVQGSGSYWDTGSWDSFFYDARVVASPQAEISGTGQNLSMIFYSSSAIDQGHTIQGAILHFTVRRLER